MVNSTSVAGLYFSTRNSWQEACILEVSKYRELQAGAGKSPRSHACMLSKAGGDGRSSSRLPRNVLSNFNYVLELNQP